MKWLIVTAALLTPVQYGTQPQPMPRPRQLQPLPVPQPMEWQRFPELQAPMQLAPLGAPPPVCQNVCGPYGCQTQCY